MRWTAATLVASRRWRRKRVHFGARGLCPQAAPTQIPPGRGRGWIGVFCGISLAALLLSASPAFAETVNVAVAANFTAVAEELAGMFEAESGHKAVLSFGATG